MSNTNGAGVERRDVLYGAAGLALTAIGASAEARASEHPGRVLRTETGVEGRPGDFAFLTGEWRIANRMIKPGTTSEWIEFPGEATVWQILGGVGSVEELRIPARDFAGMGLRLLDVQRKVWVDHWVNVKSGVVSTPGQEGVFRDGVGTFTSEETIDGVRHVYRGVWDRITDTSCRWSQGASRDGGRTWDDSWFMDWTRVA